MCKLKTNVSFSLHFFHSTTRTMDKFHLVKTIGNGSYGVVYLVQNETTKELRVIKEINCLGKTREEFEKQLMEIRIQQELMHENIIRIYGASRDNGKIQILMEYANSGDLSDLISSRNGKFFSEEEIIDIFVQMCLAIKYIHDRKIVHRDLKPGNIYLTNKTIIKIGDFGLARMLDHTIDKINTQIGTPYYVAPEILLGKPYSFSADMWSLGCILFELCTLHVPFPGNSIPEVFSKILSEKNPPIPSRYSNEIKYIISSLFVTNPEERKTIYDVLNFPLIKYKAIAMLGDKFYVEMSHTVFHGELAGKTPENMKDTLLNINYDIDMEKEHVDTRFKFMGRPIGIKKSLKPKEKIHYIRTFIENLVGRKKYRELREIANDPHREEMNVEDEYVIDLILQLIEYQEEQMT